LLLAVALAACIDPGSGVLARVELPGDQCWYVVGSAPDDLWCIDGTVQSYVSITLDVFHYDGTSWSSVIRPVLDSGWTFAYATAGNDAIWLVAPRYQVDGVPTVWRISADGSTEDHSGEFEPMASKVSADMAAHDGVALVRFHSAQYRFAHTSFEKLAIAPSPNPIPLRVFDANDAWGCAYADATEQLAHFDGASWTTLPVPCSSSFAAPDDAWSYRWMPDGVISALAHFDGAAWRWTEIPAEEVSSVQAARIDVAAIGNHRAAIFVLRHDSSSGETDLLARSWDGSTLSQLQPLYHIDRYCRRTFLEECAGPLVSFYPPLGDGTLVAVSDRSVFLGSPSLVK
jgi:hypothetical protein